MGGDPADSNPDGRRSADQWLGFDAVWSFELDAGVVSWSHGIEPLLGYPDGRAADLDWWTALVHPDDRAAFADALAAALETGGPWRGEYRLQRADGEDVPVRVAGLVVREATAERVLLCLEEARPPVETSWSPEAIEERYGVLAEQDLLGFFVIRNGEVVYANEAFCALHDADAKTLYSMGPAVQLVPEERRASLSADLRRLLAGEREAVTYRGEVLRIGGGRLNVIARLTAVRRGAEPTLIGVVVDRTEQVAAERAYEETERLFMAVFENALDPMVIAGDDGAIVDVNDAAAAVVGADRASLVGRRLSEVEALGVDVGGAREAVREAETGRGDLRITRPDGEARILEYALTMDVLPGRDLLVFRDVTERRRQEAALREGRERLDFMNALLRHHLLNGLNIVLATADDLAADLDGANRAELDRIRERGTAMVEHIQTMRSLFRSIRAREAGDFAPLALAPVLEAAVEETAAVYADAAFDVELPTEDLAVPADELLVEVFENLLDNAVRYQAGPEPVVEVRVDADATTVSVHVADRGPGIPRSVREDVFDAGTTSSGSGFGLNFVQLLLTLYEGTLAFADREGGGSVVTVTLPRARRGSDGG